jgi:isopropylmalate/homocitrate/citramalate synthase
MASGLLTSETDNFGVDYIEVTSPVSSPQSFEDCKRICQLGLKVSVDSVSLVVLGTDR